MTVETLKPEEYNAYFNTYLSLVPKNVGLMDGLEASFKSQLAFFNAIPQDKHNYRYEASKWTIKELIVHIIDTERVFAYRALRLSRKDKTPLPGYNENDYADNCNANSRSFADIMEEYTLVRQSTLALFKSFNQDMLIETGNASGHDISVRALGFILIGHEMHHVNIINERYL